MNINDKTRYFDLTTLLTFSMPVIKFCHLDDNLQNGIIIMYSSLTCVQTANYSDDNIMMRLYLETSMARLKLGYMNFSVSFIFYPSYLKKFIEMQPPRNWAVVVVLDCKILKITLRQSTSITN